MSYDVTIVVNLHREGMICRATLESITRACQMAQHHSINYEILCVLDCSDVETKSVITQYASSVKIYETDFSDLSRSRNFGASKASGKYTTFIDGDDLWGNKWILEAFRLAEGMAESKFIIHPRVNLYFGKGLHPHYWIHPDMRYERIELHDILAANKWTSLSFARTETYKNCAYVENKMYTGFGYEDWVWHIQTIFHGYLHIVAEDTIHFIRQKLSGSLMQEANAKSVLPNISSIFNTL